MRSTRFITLGIGALLCCSIVSCASVPSSTSIRLQVVDEATGQPIKGVVATAYWIATRGTLGGEQDVGVVATGEGASDDSGNIRLVATITKSVSGGEVKDGPSVWLYKRGYHAKQLSNEKRNPFGTPYSDWNGKSVSIVPINNSNVSKEYEEFANWDLIGLDYAKRLPGCSWKSFPISLRASMQDRQYFLAKGIPSVSSWAGLLLAADADTKKEGCGSTKEYLEGLQR